MTDPKAAGKAAGGALPVILIAAVVQGWALYALHVAIKNVHWPATASSWLLACYAIALFVPLTTQLLAQRIRLSMSWAAIAAIGVTFAYFGWHHGAAVSIDPPEQILARDTWFELALQLAILWLLMLPFIQARLADGHWRPRYETLFAYAWLNKLTLAEAGLFTGLLWLLLFLWAQLFKMLGIDFFRELFAEPIFVYPVTSLTFGIALHLIGSLERLTQVVLEQLLNVLKWLALIAGLILTLFTIALVFKLPGMIASGQRAIGAAWLLWLVAVMVLLLNAAYRNGNVEQPYPKLIATGLRYIVPLTAVIALTAIYAMYLRIETFGTTVTRVWAVIVTAMACIYAVGYSVAALRPGRWMAGIARINIAAAVFLIAVMSLALTRLMSPYRIAADSQFELAKRASTPTAWDHTGRNETPLHYLRFRTGSYGIVKLKELAQLEDHPRAAEIRADAKAMLDKTEPWSPAPAWVAQSQLDKLRLPAGRQVDAALRDAMIADLTNNDVQLRATAGEPDIGGVFVDLDRDAREEFVLVYGVRIFAYTQSEAGAWERAGELMPSLPLSRDNDVLERMLNGALQVREPRWRGLQVGQTLLRMDNP